MRNWLRFHWLKRFMPRGLYGRVSLILLLPVLGLQFSVSLVFIQRHFEGVTRQMTEAVAVELRYLSDLLAEDAPPIAERAAGALGISMQRLEAPGPDRAGLFDLSGQIVAETLRSKLPNMRALDLCGTEDSCTTRDLRVDLEINGEIWRMRIGRHRVSASNPHQMLVIMGLLGALLTLISFLYLRNQLRPIAQLSKVATAYGKGQMLPYKIRGSTEVRAAAAAFLDMRNRIERQAQARQLMLSGISHDLRSPLTRLRLGLALLPEEESAEMLRDVEDMQKMLDAFLDYASDQADDATEPCDPAEILRDALAAAHRAGLAIHAGPCAELEAPLRLRPLALRRALDNLIGNAARYGSKIRLSLFASPRVLRFVVEDDGPGIPEDARQDAMRPFTRLDLARNQDQGSGVGLGLAIVGDVARRHGGRLDLDKSDDLGGLRASLILPR